MRWGISGTPLPAGFPFLKEIAQACSHVDIPPCLVGAIKLNETGRSNDPTIMQEGTVPGTDFLSNGDNSGHGIFQLTSSWPSDWYDPLANTVYAIRVFIVPAITYWNASKGQTGDALVRCVTAEFNAGRGRWYGLHDRRNIGALGGFGDGDVGLYTTDDYPRRALDNYRTLVAGRIP